MKLAHITGQSCSSTTKAKGLYRRNVAIPADIRLGMLNHSFTDQTIHYFIYVKSSVPRLLYVDIGGQIKDLLTFMSFVRHKYQEGLPI